MHASCRKTLAIFGLAIFVLPISCVIGARAIPEAPSLVEPLHSAQGLASPITFMWEAETDWASDQIVWLDLGAENPERNPVPLDQSSLALPLTGQVCSPCQWWVEVSKPGLFTVSPVRDFSFDFTSPQLVTAALDGVDLLEDSPRIIESGTPSLLELSLNQALDPDSVAGSLTWTRSDTATIETTPSYVEGERTLSFETSLPLISDGYRVSISGLRGANEIDQEGTVTLDFNILTPIGPVTMFQEIPGDGQVELSWVEPTDANFARVVIRRNVGAPPAQFDEGEIVCTSCSSPHIDTGLTNDTTYGYSAWAFSIDDVESLPESVQSTPLDLPAAEQSVLLSPNAQMTGQFGYTVDIAGDFAIVGARFEDSPGLNSGSAYIYEREDPTGWVFRAELLPSDKQADDELGISVAISGNHAIVGARREDGVGDLFSDAGAAYIFERNGGTGSWVEIAALRASDAENDALFGTSVAIDGTIAIVGAFLDEGTFGTPINNAGAAYVFELDGTWDEVAILGASDAEMGDQFGTSVAVSGSYAIVGANRESDFGSLVTLNGAAYVFERDGSGVWSQTAILRASDRQTGDEFGSAVAISGERAVIGAPTEDGGTVSAPNAGVAYVFERNGSGEWIETAIIRASDFQEEDRFGFSVAIESNRILIGALLEDGGDGDPIPSAGAAYLFVRNSASLWSEAAVFRALSSHAFDEYGRSVSISGGRAIVGAPNEDGGPTNPIVGAGAVNFLE